MTSAPLRVAFRTDAGIEIGTGHVMRCLTMANALKARGAESVFLCRAHDGNLLDFIAAQGFQAVALPALVAAKDNIRAGEPPHAAWLGTDWASDASDTLAAVHGHFGDDIFDWLIIDHYALDARWETALRPACRYLMVIDDLADRPHDCDLLLDQSLGRKAADYAGLAPQSATLLIGPQYALLRPEFARLRAASLARRARPELHKLLVTMGGIDKDNATGKVLDALATCALPVGVDITIVMGAQAPWLDQVRTKAALMPVPTEVRIGVSDMATLMSQSDLAIGGGGMTSIERCVLGLPTILIIQAQNQMQQAHDLEQAGAAVVYDPNKEYSAPVLAKMIAKLSAPEVYIAMSHAAASVAKTNGLLKIASHLETRQRGVT